MADLGPFVAMEASLKQFAERASQAQLELLKLTQQIEEAEHKENVVKFWRELNETA